MAHSPTAQSATFTGITDTDAPATEKGCQAASAHGQPVGSSERSGPNVASLARSVPGRCGTVTTLRWQLLASGLALLVMAWSVAIVTIPGARFVVTAPVAQAGVEAASALARLFAALVLFLFPTERSGPRLHWVAGGLVVLGLGDLVFGYIPGLLGAHAPLNTSIYEGLGRCPTRHCHLGVAA